ncbi:MAG: hypothetical protein IV090_13930 [Candidatus Sericytochromatia bacterium]|nr:hypothetical protein [Candidatus Sericytochromatia bacterium]
MINNIGGAPSPMNIPPQAASTPPASTAPARETDAPAPNAIIHAVVADPVIEGSRAAVPGAVQAARNASSEGLRGLTDIGSNLQEMAQSAFGTGASGILENVGTMASQFFQNPTAFINNQVDPNGQSTDRVNEIGDLMQQGASAIGSSFIGQALGALPDLAGRAVSQGINGIEDFIHQRQSQSGIQNGGVDTSSIDASRSSTQGLNPLNDTAGADRVEPAAMAAPALPINPIQTMMQTFDDIQNHRI